MNFTHLPLHDEQLERAVLGAMLTDTHGLRTALALLRQGPAVFYNERHQYIYTAMAALHAAGQSVDPLSVIRQLTSDGKLSKAGGGGDIMQLVGHAGSAAKMDTHTRFLMELFAKRRMGQMARELAERSGDPTADPFELLRTFQTGINSLHDTLQVKPALGLADLYHGVVDSIVQATRMPGGVTGVPSGMPSLDRVTGGWQPSDLIIIAARPAMGKTTLAVFMARVAADAQRRRGLIVTLEMSAAQLVLKMIATEAGYSTSQLRKGLLDGGEQEAEAIREKAAALLSVGLHIDDTPGMSIGELRAKAAKMHAESPLDFIVVDYLQLMSGNGTGGNREQEISQISRGLKMIAKELNIPVLALSQLSRSVETRGGSKKPMLSDLRESGAIEQDADVIVFPFRPEYYGISEDEEGNPTKDTTEIIIAKHRNGALASVVVSSRMDQGRYADLDTMAASPSTPAPAEAHAMATAIRTSTRSDFDDAPAPF
ncbi:replicative DNA helicase [Hymenobacter lapidiphilus]|uniref:Replicative DNA helicase n=1 Tax=Hymenobacter lapidiphilus TaxID=2608003 RepID=A0A7Y7U7F1_9BACT|nr:replicative DNA helicase [Hymenobacter lapidiphilus]NVO33493.1 replicative DNA helicase [Hymenobacter lapidiphilus]